MGIIWNGYIFMLPTTSSWGIPWVWRERPTIRSVGPSILFPLTDYESTLNIPWVILWWNRGTPSVGITMSWCRLSVMVTHLYRTVFRTSRKRYEYPFDVGKVWLPHQTSDIFQITLSHKCSLKFHQTIHIFQIICKYISVFGKFHQTIDTFCCKCILVFGKFHQTSHTFHYKCILVFGKFHQTSHTFHHKP